MQNPPSNASQEVLATQNLTLYQLHQYHEDELKLLLHEHKGKIPQEGLWRLRQLEKEMDRREQLEQHNPDAMQALKHENSSLKNEIIQLSNEIKKIERERLEIVDAFHKGMEKIEHTFEKIKENNNALLAKMLVEMQTASGKI
jgi:predicted RNase H-like nuclease (RuvC/YqgF family)